jgi:DNA polymerase-3 subunit delta'
MTIPSFFDPKKSLNLYGLFDNFNFFKNLYLKNRLPKVLMLSGKKGIGKSTIINHLMFFIFDKKNFNENTCEFDAKSTFYNQFINNIYPNIIYVSGLDFKNTKIDDLRNLKTKILKSTISDLPRFIIFDDVELFNINIMNSLLKLIEEPSRKNYFILINNKSKKLIETISSRCLDIKIIFNERKRLDIIELLINKLNINNLVINPKSSQLTPGYFIKFNYIFIENEISLDKDFLKNLSILLNLYKKDKDIIYIDIILFLTDNYFNGLKEKNLYTKDKVIEYKRFVFDNINKYFIYNLNQKALLNIIDNKINE